MCYCITTSLEGKPRAMDKWLRSWINCTTKASIVQGFERKKAVVVWCLRGEWRGIQLQFVNWPPGASNPAHFKSKYILKNSIYLVQLKTLSLFGEALFCFVKNKVINPKTVSLQHLSGPATSVLLYCSENASQPLFFCKTDKLHLTIKGTLVPHFVFPFLLYPYSYCIIYKYV